jgi:spermidine/putrescine transport system permease protein
MTQGYRLANAMVLGLIGAAIAAPLVVTVVVSVWSRTLFGFQPDFTLANYATFFGSQRVDVLLRTLLIASTATLIMLAVAYAAALIILRGVPRHWQRTVLFLFAAPFLVNYIVRTLVWTDLLGRNGAVNTLLLGLGVISAPLDWLLYSRFSVYVGLISAYLPFMIFPIWVSLSAIDRRLDEASWMLGKNRLQSFLAVTLPLSMPGLAAAFIFGFVGVFGELAVSRILGGAGFQLYGNAIESALNSVNFPLAAAMASVSIVLMFVLLCGWLLVFNLKLFLGDLLPSR